MAQSWRVPAFAPSRFKNAGEAIVGFTAFHTWERGLFIPHSPPCIYPRPGQRHSCTSHTAPPLRLPNCCRIFLCNRQQFPNIVNCSHFHKPSLVWRCVARSQRRTSGRFRPAAWKLPMRSSTFLRVSFFLRMWCFLKPFLDHMDMGRMECRFNAANLIDACSVSSAAFFLTARLVQQRLSRIPPKPFPSA